MRNRKHRKVQKKKKRKKRTRDERTRTWVQRTRSFGRPNQQHDEASGKDVAQFTAKKKVVEVMKDVWGGEAVNACAFVLLFFVVFSQSETGDVTHRRMREREGP